MLFDIVLLNFFLKNINFKIDYIFFDKLKNNLFIDTSDFMN